jgi:hypothetical protein
MDETNIGKRKLVIIRTIKNKKKNKIIVGLIIIVKLK